MKYYYDIRKYGGEKINILDKIVKYRQERQWTEYQLSEKAGLPQSTISSWYSKGMLPSLASLEKICNAFGVTLSQFFISESDTVVALTAEQNEMLQNWNRLDQKQKKSLLEFLKTL